MKYRIGSPGNQCVLTVEESELSQDDLSGALGATLLPVSELFRLIRLCHPDRCGEPYSRYEIIREIKRRGLIIFEAMGWPCENLSKYKNRYTASVETLQEMYEHRAGSSWRMIFEEWVIDNAFSILEHWYPEELWESSGLNRDGEQLVLGIRRKGVKR